MDAIRMESGVEITRRHSMWGWREMAAMAESGFEAMQAVAHASARAPVGAMTVAERVGVLKGRPVAGSIVCPTRP